MYIPNLSVVCFFICLSYFIFYCALLLFCAQAWHGKTLSSRNDPIFFCSLHWRNLSLYNKITTTHFKQIRFWWKNVIKFRGKVYSNFFKFVQQLFFLSVCRIASLNPQHIKPWSKWTAAAEDHTGCCSCQLRTGNGGYNSHRVQNWTIEVWSDESQFLLRQMVGSEFGIKNMKAWIHPALSQRFRLVVLV